MATRGGQILPPLARPPAPTGVDPSSTDGSTEPGIDTGSIDSSLDSGTDVNSVDAGTDSVTESPSFDMTDGLPFCPG